MLGKEILGYHVDEKIGSGGFGTVYKVSKTNVTGTYVRALKHIEVPTKRQYVNILNSMGGDSTKADDYFANILKNIVGEIKILSALSESGNQNIVRYYENDVIETHSPKKYDIYILMEYLTPFPEYLDNTSLTVKDVIKLGKDILNALIACHGRNIIHRDIKDDNIFVASDGTYKIGDFGVSKALKDQSRAASIKGTPNFIAPEVYLGKENYDHTVDIYSLGIVLYRLLNNLRNPFLPEFPNAYTSEDEDIAFEARMTGKIPELPNMAKNELGEAILKAIKLRNERYNTAKEFLEALENVEKALSPIYLAQGIGIFNLSQQNEETVACSNSDEDITIAVSAFAGQAEEQNSNDSDLFKTIGLFSSDNTNVNQEESKQQEKGENKTIALDNTKFKSNKEIQVVNDKKKSKHGKTAVIIAVAAITLVVLICGLLIFLKNRNEENIDDEVITGEIQNTEKEDSESNETSEPLKPSDNDEDESLNPSDNDENSHVHEYKNGYCTICGLYRSGKKITFGSYPQTEVTESALKSTLNAKAGTLPTSNNSYKWISYGYYDNGELSNFMWYIDVIQDGLKYRGVYFTSYRHICTTKSLQVDDSYQDNNGYYTNTIYWFKYEPIFWTILSENTTNGTALILCDMIIDSQEYYITDSGTRTIDGKTVYPNNYAHSTIKKWLNETFYNTAFSELQKQVIITTDVDNGVTSTGYDSNLYACENTNDKVFLLSRQDITDTLYGFEKSTSTIDIMRQKKTTDYAQSQGCYTNNGEYAGNGWWMLRSPNNNESVYSYVVDKTGQAYLINYVNYVNQGVVPALQIDLSGKNEDSIYTREGDKITFGSYPQTEVTESALKATLNAKAGTLPTSTNSQAWTSYEYYIEGNVSDFMWYIDIEQNGEKYRGVYFTAYRPKVTMDSSSMETTNQDDNSYRINTVYWFKYEPISWTILSEDTANETAVILCDMIIDSQAFDTNDSSNSYIQSTIRKWLNNDFYNIGFTSLQKNIIISSIVNDEKLDNVIANDNIFLLSTFDLENNSYGLTDIMLQKNVSDYSRVQGANIDDEKGVWWLKSPYGVFDTATSVVSFTGGIGGGSVVSDTSIGVVPILRIKL